MRQRERDFLEIKNKDNETLNKDPKWDLKCRSCWLFEDILMKVKYFMVDLRELNLKVNALLKNFNIAVPSFPAALAGDISLPSPPPPPPPPPPVTNGGGIGGGGNGGGSYFRRSSLT
ncbi:hypothetical protein LOK49_LG10G01717 [Camellia lanceoleosa]|uniref:Uncharacterized protein n=1 Tax=Camellia lanceoleosa TaxID=1840588 RepID=A0ACC0G8N5_9ERIC|nr:hypothetical protein LOK49_LG10G01717 [Camellia lanceoleosa]